MGGPCSVKKVDANGKHVATVRGPPCTDNFQIIEFVYNGKTYYSAEQCFQSLKFKANSTMRQKIQQAKPKEKETDGAYGMRVWGLGQSRSSPLTDNYENKKLKIMFMINLAKYACNEELQKELVEETKDFEMIGGPSTWQWSKWNGLIQMYIRKLCNQNKNLKELLGHYEEMSTERLQAVLHGQEEVEEEVVQDDAKENDPDGGDENDENGQEDDAKMNQQVANDQDAVNEEAAAAPVADQNAKDAK